MAVYERQGVFFRLPTHWLWNGLCYQTLLFLTEHKLGGNRAVLVVSSLVALIKRHNIQDLRITGRNLTVRDYLCGWKSQAWRSSSSCAYTLSRGQDEGFFFGYKTSLSISIYNLLRYFSTVNNND